jgi:diguanylate cyclase (GGDEF)-like protein
MVDEILKILLVDDDEDDYIITRDLFSEIKGMTFDLQWISTYDEAIEVMALNNHGVYLLDYRLGERTGLELLSKAISNGCRSPIILLTGQGDHELDIKAIKTGASDYLVKSEINADLLERSIRYAIERKRTEDDIYRMAYYDSLTGLPNRLLFQDRLKQVIQQAGREKNIVAVLFLDVDNFKRINDTFGHTVGDNLLKEISTRLGHIVRKSDSVARRHLDNMFARLGGDEFTVLLSDIHEVEDSLKVAERINNAISKPFSLENQEVFVSVSTGIAIYPNDGNDCDTLLKNADSAMYFAKEQGKNNYQFYMQSMNARAFESLAMENDLRRALENDELLLYYQPQVDIVNGKVIGVEALIRWQHPEKGMISPVDFIPVAEKNGLINPIGEWVLKTACNQSRKWRDQGMPPLLMSVNIASQQFQQKNFIEIIQNSVNTAGISPTDLMLEITESTLMENTDAVSMKLHEVTGMGVQLSIDDFGTGYSSLSYLKRFPIHAIKIDYSFVKEININPDDAAIVEAIILMANSLKLDVVAEGVETEDQLKFLREQGCKVVQGFLFSRPLPADEMYVYLNSEEEGAGSVMSAICGEINNGLETRACSNTSDPEASNI